MYRYFLTPTSQFYFCGVPFRLDASNFCSGGCEYCFSSTRGGKKANKHKYCSVSEMVKQLDILVIDQKHRYSIIGELIKNNCPIHFGGMSDPLSKENIDTTYKLLQILSALEYPVIMSTKFPERLLSEKIHNIISNYRNLVLQVSFVTSDETISKQLEKNCESPAIRIEAMKQLSSYGVRVFARIQPVFIELKDDIINNLVPLLSQYGCEHITLEMYKLPVEKSTVGVNVISDVFNKDYRKSYIQNGAILVGREWILPLKIKYDILMEIKKVINTARVTVGMAEYGMYHMSDTKCCCGIDKLYDFNYLKGNFSYVISTASKGEIYWKDVLKHWIPEKSIRMYINSNCRRPELKSIVEFLKDKWNTPGSVNAPDAYYGVKCLNKIDYDGNVIYYKGVDINEK